MDRKAAGAVALWLATITAVFLLALLLARCQGM